jgi:hypothetical protein
MRRGPFIVGLLIGLVGGAGGMLYLVAQSKPADATEIAFSSKGFIDVQVPNGDDSYITVNGTMAGDNEAYPNSTYGIRCFKNQKLCWIAFVEQIADQPKLAVSHMNGPYAVTVVEWTPYEVVAGDDGSDGCVKTTITISRKTKELLWVEEPVNQTQPFCKDEDTKIRKRWIEDSPTMKKLDAWIHQR